ncbi:MAG: hypothetical protein Q4C58_07850 [Eubacteriales bacterium]|nr:hypothetical protein [Eubacteriales bacterium]
MYYTDIHSHILPGVDDGSQSMEESLLMLEIAEKENIHKIILTPHQKPDRKCVSVDGIERRMLQLQDELRRRHIDIELYPGSEILYSHDAGERLLNGSICTLAGSHYALVEFMPDENWPYIRDGLYGLICSGYWPVVAHVERYMHVVKNLDRVQELIEMGCYIQINSGSLTGDWGFETKRTCVNLVKNHLVHFIGTDAHRGTGSRVPKMAKCAAVLKKKAGDRYAEELLFENAENIFEDTEI